MDLAVIPECYVDTNMLETLVPPNKQYNHQKGCGTVAKVMQERFNDSFALGIIDKDKKELDYLKEFDIVCAHNNLLLHKHKTRHHFIIQIYPAIERFIIDNAEAAGVSITEFGLSDEIELLKKQAKSVSSKSDVRFKRLFKALVANEAEDILRLRSWILYLKNNPYNCDLDHIVVL